MNRGQAIRAIHDRCAVYTAPPTAARLLDLAGWRADRDLSASTLLEPCAGEGAILLEAVSRLVASLRRHRRSLGRRNLTPRIRAFEFHVPAAAIAREKVKLLLIREGVSWGTSRALAEAWVRESDFLLEAPATATHVAANPPYLRWSKLPPLLAAEYREKLPPAATRGDVALAFLDRMIEWAGEGTQIAALVSDRWMFAQYGAEFITRLADRDCVVEVVDDRPKDPFVRRVGAYSAIVRLTRGSGAPASSGSGRTVWRAAHARLLAEYGNLVEAGCVVKVGPALGCGTSFVVRPGDEERPELELTRPYVDRAELACDVIKSTANRVVVPFDRSGRLVELAAWPKFASWISRHEAKLRARSQIRGDDGWWRTIDAVGPVWHEGPKLLLSEMSRDPKAVLDLSGGIPAHSVYAIWSGEWPVEALRRVLNDGLLRLTAEAEAPMLKNDWFRFYKRFIVRTPLPRWSGLSDMDREALTGNEEGAYARSFAALFGFEPGAIAGTADSRGR